MRREGMLQNAQGLYSKGNWLHALAILESIPDELQDGKEKYYLIGLCYCRLYHWEQAIATLQKYIQKGSNEAKRNHSLLVVSFARIKSGQSEAAKRQLIQLLDSKQNLSKVLCLLAYCDAENAHYKEAIDWYTKALEIEEHNTTALNGIGYLLACTSDDLEKALKYCRLAIEQQSENPMYVDSLAWVLYRMGLKKEAGEFIQKALYHLPSEAIIKQHAQAISFSIGDYESKKCTVKTR